MRRGHFERLRPVCPVCRSGAESGSPLRIAQIEREENADILEGSLHCSNPDCLREFPIFDGIPLLVTNIRQYVSDNILAITARRDLAGSTETMLGDCCGPGSVFEQTRQFLSSYAWDHYGDLDPDEPATEPRPGSVARNLQIACEAAQAFQPGATRSAVLDAGCSVGRATFALAEQTDELVLGVDLNFPMLRLASEVLRHGTARYSRRRVGLVYERHEFPARFANARNVDFWACDTTALPFPAGTFSFAVGLNVLDCVHVPRELLVSLGNVLQTGGKAVVASPYDWSASATPLEAWLGGHSQRSPSAGSPEAVLRKLLTPGGPSSVNSLRLVSEREDLPWHVRLHDRSTMSYKLHMVVAEKV